MTTALVAAGPVSERVSVRFGASLVSNALRLVLSFAAGLLVARGLGVAQYGSYHFLLASVASLSQFVDLGTSQAFFTFIARERRQRRFLTIYAAWLAAQFVLVTVAVGFLAPRTFISALWVGERRTAVLLAFAATFLMNEVWEAVSQLGEARRRTVVVQAGLTVQAAAHVVLVGGAVYLGRFSVSAAFLFIILEYGALVALLGPSLLSENVAGAEAPPVTLHTVCAEFWSYCRPLVVYSTCGFLIMFADRWLLQRFGGSTQQGFFGIAQQLSTISLLATTSVLQVFWTEIASANASGNRARVLLLFRSTSRALYFVGAWTTCLLIPYVRELLALTAGSGYTGALTAFAVMLFYPIYQSIGRVYASLLQAVGETAVYARVGIAVLVLSLPITYFLIAPREITIPGLALGAVGLALKTVVVGALSVNLLGYAIASRVGAPYDWKYQVATVSGLLLLAFACRLLVQQVMTPSTSGPGLAAIALGAAGYVAVSVSLVYRRPEMVGLTRDQVTTIVNLYRGLLPSV